MQKKTKTAATVLARELSSTQLRANELDKKIYQNAVRSTLNEQKLTLADKRYGAVKKAASFLAKELEGTQLRANKLEKLIYSRAKDSKVAEAERKLASGQMAAIEQQLTGQSVRLEALTSTATKINALKQRLDTLEVEVSKMSPKVVKMRLDGLSKRLDKTEELSSNNKRAALTLAKELVGDEKRSNQHARSIGKLIDHDSARAIAVAQNTQRLDAALAKLNLLTTQLSSVETNFHVNMKRITNDFVAVPTFQQALKRRSKDYAAAVSNDILALKKELSRLEVQFQQRLKNIAKAKGAKPNKK